MSIPIDISNMALLLKEYGFTPENCDPVIIHQLLKIVQDTTAEVLQEADLVRETIGAGPIVTSHCLSYVLPSSSMESHISPYHTANGSGVSGAVSARPEVFTERAETIAIEQPSYTTTTSIHNPCLTRTTAALTSLMLKTFPQLLMGRGGTAIKFNPYGIGQSTSSPSSTNSNNQSQSQSQPPSSQSYNPHAPQPLPLNIPPSRSSIFSRSVFKSASSMRSNKMMAAWGGADMQFPQALVMMGLCATQYAIRRNALRPRSVPRAAKNVSTKYKSHKSNVEDAMSDEDGDSSEDDTSSCPTHKSNAGSNTTTTANSLGSDAEQPIGDLNWPDTSLSRRGDKIKYRGSAISAAQVPTVFTDAVGTMMSKMPTEIPIMAGTMAGTGSKGEQKDSKGKKDGGAASGTSGTGASGSTVASGTLAGTGAAGTSSALGGSKATRQQQQQQQLTFFSPTFNYCPPLDAIDTFASQMVQQQQRDKIQVVAVNTIVQQRELFANMAMKINLNPIPPPTIISPVLSLPLPSLDNLIDVGEDYSLEYRVRGGEEAMMVGLR